MREKSSHGFSTGDLVKAKVTKDKRQKTKDKRQKAKGKAATQAELPFVPRAASTFRPQKV
jgi:hypothetical protein